MGKPALGSLSVAEIRKTYLDEQRAPSSKTLGRMRRDPRLGVRRIHAVLARRAAAMRRAKRRAQELLEHERDLRQQGRKAVAGVDEVGVGPLAGPVVAAAVMFGPGVSILKLDDSKTLDPQTRTEVAEEIRGRARCHAYGIANVAEINSMNVYQASLLAMRRAVRRLAVEPDHLLIDARSLPDLKIVQEAVVGGDRRHFSIAAASILAKTHRDGLMTRLDRQYPGYGLASHKGYSTPQHQEAISRLGPSPIHRTSYSFIDELTGAYSPLFYQIRSSLKSVTSYPQLQACRRDLRHALDQLSGEEIKKLRLLINRRSKRFAVATQLDLIR